MTSAPTPPRASPPGEADGAWWREIPVLLGGLCLFYALLGFAHYSTGAAVSPEIQLHPSALPRYAAYSLLRLGAAYLLSLAFAIAYGYLAAASPRAERILIPVLDTLQSIPILSFLPGVMLAMVALFPGRQLGVELGAILLIFSGQVWNMAFSFYSSLKTLPQEMREAAGVYGFNRWQRMVQMELPYAATGLIWNSMMSVAGGWFFLMACEMFVLGSRDFRLPGLGSWLQVAANRGDGRALALGLGVMVAAVVLTDVLVWRPATVWAQKFKVEQVEAADVARSPVLEFLHRSRLLHAAGHATRPLFARLYARLAAPGRHAASAAAPAWRRTALRVLAVWAGAVLVWLAVRMFASAAAITALQLRSLVIGAGATFLRVESILLLAAAWTVPAGVILGLHPRLAAIAQPLAQVAASIPATAFFPVILLALIRTGHGLGAGSLLLLLLGTQWYVLFNVIAGATAIPSELREVCAVYRFPRWHTWRTLLLPAIFPYLITGLITASGGAWNASIVAEYVQFQGRTLTVRGLGATISQATAAGDTHLLLAATILLAAIVIVINRLVWRRLYRLAATRYKLDA